MKTFKYFLSVILFVAAVIGCTKEDFGSDAFVSTAIAPTNVNALFTATQDNTGRVTITPNGEGAVSYEVYFGDNTAESAKVAQGKSVLHVYPEGTYDVKIIATNITGLQTETTKNLVVSFKAPENLVVEITNDKATSNKVNVKATADYGIFYDVYFGEPGNDMPVTANIGEIASYTYAESGTYTIRVVAKSAGIKTTEYTQDFEATKIAAPIVNAPKPPFKNDVDVISIFSDAYTDITISEWNPDWSQSTKLSNFVVNGDTSLKYDFFNYTGIVTDYGNPTDVSAMEYVHFDYWTNEATNVGIKLVNTLYADGDPLKDAEIITENTTFGKWVSVEIPMSEFDMDLTAVTQLVLSSTGSTVFIDNIYFWRESTGAPIAGALPIDFEYPFTLSSFDGGNTSVVANPDTDGNSSAYVAQLIKGAGKAWAGSKITVDTPFEITESLTVTAKVWSPRVGLNLLMKFEDAAPWPDTKATAEITATTTVANAWEELTFTITGVDASLEYYNLVLIMDNGTVGDGSSNYTIYVDDISVASFLDFEYPFTLSSFDGGNTSVVANPDTDGNSSAYVAQLIKGAGKAWAGSKITVDIPFEITESMTITAKVWSPRVGLNLLMKFEDAAPWPDTKATAEITATTTVANAWEELTFTITGVDTSLEYYNLVLIMDNGTVGDGSSDYTIFIDDIAIK